MIVPAARIVFSADDRSEILRRIDATLQSGALTLGPQTSELEVDFADRHGAAFAVATSTGTSALEIILRTLDVAGRDVIVPSNTFFATAAAVLRAGGRIVFADVDAATLALSEATIERVVTPNTAGVLHVHIGGAITPAMAAIAESCNSRGHWLVEDAAHAHGASFDGRQAGRFGVAAAFSMYPTKVITSAEGGIIVTDDERMRNEAVIYRDQGKAGFRGGDHVRLGSAWRLSEVHAAIGVVHLRRLDEFIVRRRDIARYYRSELARIAGIDPLPHDDSRSESNWYKFIAMLDPAIDRTWFKKTLREEHDVTAAGEVYAKPLHAQPIFHDLAHAALSVTDDVCARHVCLPIHSDMTEVEAHQVVTAVAETLGSC